MKRRIIRAMLSLSVVAIMGCSGGGGGGGESKNSEPTSGLNPGTEGVGQTADGSIPWIGVGTILQGPKTVRLKSAESGGGDVTIVATKISGSVVSLDLSVDPPVAGIGITVWLKKGSTTLVPSTDQSWVLTAKNSQAAWQAVSGKLIDAENATSAMFGIVYLDNQTHGQIGRLVVDDVDSSDSIAFQFVNK